MKQLLLPLIYKSKGLKKSLLLIVLIYLTGFGSASAAVDIPGSKDLAVFDRYTLSSIVDYQISNVPEYALPTGKIKKVNGVIKSESERYLSGDLIKVTYQIPSGHDTEEVAAFVQAELNKRQATILYQCAARDCGSSNDWANQIFGISKLYGLAGEQYYWAATFAAENKKASNALAIYLTQRGNRQVFLHIESLQSASSKKALASDEILTRWQSGERVFIPSEELTEERTDELAQAVQQVLDSRPYGKVWLVGHQGGTSPFLILLKESEEVAQGLKQVLVNLGLPENRIFVRGVGPLAPVESSVPENRIEILVE